MSLTVADDACVIALPHIEARDGALWFMQSRRALATMSAEQSAVWQYVVSAGEAGAQLALLRERFGAGADDTLAEFLAMSVAVVAEPHSTAARPRVLVIEPHSDDAALSIGATMWSRRHDTEFVLATMGSRSNFTSYWNLDRGYFPVADITALRNAEARLFMRLVGGEHIAVGLAEAALRYHDDDWTQDWYAARKYSVYASNNHRAPEADVQAWAVAIERLLLGDRRGGYDEVWLPLGVGTHSDHELTRNAGLRALGAWWPTSPDTKVVLYQDVPYDGQFPHHVQSLVGALRGAGAVLDPVSEPMAEHVAQKLALLGVFASQFKVAALREGVLASGGEPPAEHVWRLTSLPSSVDEAAMHIDAPIVAELAAQLRAQAARLRSAKVVRVFLVQPAGRWQQDIDLLLAALPTATVEVYTSPSAYAEVADASRHSKVRVVRVGNGRLAWPFVAARVLLRRPAPAAICYGLRAGQARLLSRLLFPSRPVMAVAFEQYVNAVRLTLAAEVGE